ncbi:MAG: hypothetical protein NZ929_01735 [Aigarchaeota archaeon]|nr:hypothetical protein [Aigarchaeota archaeon]MCX8192950.1 hypothetical protein [Nitrososphaeria archaeon]
MEDRIFKIEEDEEEEWEEEFEEEEEEGWEEEFEEEEEEEF